MTQKFKQKRNIKKQNILNVIGELAHSVEPARILRNPRLHRYKRFLIFMGEKIKLGNKTTSDFSLSCQYFISGCIKAHLSNIRITAMAIQ